MSNELDIFKNNPLADLDPDLYKQLMDETSKLAGGGPGVKRISIRGSRFRLMSGGEQIGKANPGPLNIMVLKAGDINRTYFEGAYDPEKPGKPTCWSADGDTPADEVPAGQKQANQCAKCPQNVKGSGQGNSRACRFSQRLAILLEGDHDNVYQMQVPAASLFGAGSGDKMPMQAYVKFLKAHNMPLQGIMTEVRFDEDSESPKLFFRPIRPLQKDEIRAILDKRDSEEATSAVTLTVSQVDEPEEFVIEEEPAKEAPAAPPKEAAKEPAKKANPFADDGDEEEAPPKVKKAKPEPKVEPVDTDKLAALADEWGDDEFDD